MSTERAERLRLTWVEAYRGCGDAGAVCRRFGVSRPTLRKWLRRYEAEGVPGLRARSRRPHRSPEAKVGQVEQELILSLRRERRLGVKRLRNELAAWSAALAGDNPQDTGTAPSRRVAGAQTKASQAQALYSADPR